MPNNHTTKAIPYNGLARIEIPSASTHFRSSKDCSDAPSQFITEEELLLQEFTTSLKEYFPRSANYDSVTALLIYWGNDDLGCESEVFQLADLLYQDFNYETKILKLPQRDPDMVLRAEVDLLVVKSNSDGKRNLLIVYYGGHGKPDDPRRGSVWCAHNSPSSSSLQWDKIQPQLERADGDVVLIIDSCHAAQAAREGKLHKIELLAASAMNVKTPRAGDGSFTAALIAEMKRLLKSHTEGFSISQLQGHLIGRPAALQETPVYTDLSRNTQPSIILHPIPRLAENRKVLTLRPRASFTLNISLIELLDKDHVRRIAEWLKRSPPNTVSDISIEKLINNMTIGDSRSGSTQSPISVPLEDQYDGEDSFDDESDGGSHEEKYDGEDSSNDEFDGENHKETIGVKNTGGDYYDGPWVEMDKEQ